MSLFPPPITDDEARLRAAREQDLYFSLAQDLLCLCSFDGRFLHLNPAWSPTLGYPLEEILSRPFVEFIHPEDRAITAEKMRCLRLGESVSGFENRYICRDGSYRWFQWNAIPSVEERYIYAVARDITERRRSEEELRKSEERFQLVARATREAVWDWDLVTDALWWNDEFHTLFGYSPDQLPPTIESWTDFLHPDDRERVLASIYGVIHGGEQFWSEEYQFCCGDGTYAIVHDRGYVVRDEQGKPTRMLGSMMDISPFKKIKADLEKAKEEAEAASRAKSEFLANMSHEIRTPMNGVIGMTELLLDTKLTDEQRDYAETVQSSAEALLTVINDILDFSRIEAGKLEIEQRSFPLQRTIREAMDLLSEPARRKGLPLLLTISSSLPEEWIGDSGRLRQILLNLTGNAIKFTEAGEVHIRIVPNSPPTEKLCALFSITDTGIGISAEAQCRLFQSFYQADSTATRRYGGTGLGLAISKQLVELMGGNIGVESETGQGSTFWFTLPLGTLPTSSEFNGIC